MTGFDLGAQQGPWEGRDEARRRPGSEEGSSLAPSVEQLSELVDGLRASHRELQAQNETLRRIQHELEISLAHENALARRCSRQLRELGSELTRAEQRERRRLAQVLHDDLQQRLVAIHLKLGEIRRRTDDDQIFAILQEADAILGESIEGTRGLAYELCPPILHDSGLGAALRWLAQWKLERHGLAVDVQADDGAEPTDETLRVLLFQIVRELLFNVVKHAQMTSARVRTMRLEDQVQVVVSDDGVGFDPAQLRQSSTSAHGFGLSSIRQRLELLGGALEIDAAPGGGTRIAVRVPCHGRSRENLEQSLF